MNKMTSTNKTQPSSTGGTIEFTATGLIHHAGKAYSGKSVPTEARTQAKQKWQPIVADPNIAPV